MTKDEKFGETYWTKEDIKLAPEEAGVPVTEKNITPCEIATMLRT